MPFDPVDDEGFGDGVKVKYKGVAHYFARKGDSAIDERGKPVAHFLKYMKVCEAQRFMKLIGFSYNELPNVIYVKVLY